MKNIIILCISILLASCLKLPEETPIVETLGGGAFIVNEGSFLSGNGSLSFYSYDSSKVYNDLFSKNNSRPLGDVPNSMISYGVNGYIVVNNSGKVEVIDPDTYKSKATIKGLVSPRNMAIVAESKAYITSLYSDSLAILNLNSNIISGYINLGKSSEAIIVNGSLAYVSNWLGGNKIYVINTVLDKVTDSITVGLEPESMVLDRNYRLWVLCTGGWKKEQKAEIDVINTSLNRVEQKFIFPAIEDSPSCLKIDGPGDFVYYLNKGVWKMNINSPGLPASTYIPQLDKQVFYKLGINPVNSDIFITDVGDYLHNGYLLIHTADGVFSSKHELNIIPGAIWFRLVMNQTSGSYNAGPGRQ